MRRADRLFEIVQYLRGRRLTTAAQLAQWLEVSERTIYRDIADLAASGVPIDGEAGVGYRLHPHFDLPPLMFDYEEIDALVMGARFVESWGGPRLAHAARGALVKIAAALPEQKRAAVQESRLFAPGFFIDPQWGMRLAACRDRQAAICRVRVPRRPRAGFAAPRAAVRLVLLGRHLDARRVVRAALRLPQLPPRPPQCAAGLRAGISR
jgi:biotin operon repressor